MSVVVYEKTGHIARITLNRPERLNAFSPEMYGAFNEAASRFDADPDAWVAIITGTGERAFCAGADVNMLSDSVEAGGETGLDSLDIHLEAELGTTKPIIAAVNGHCIGEGMSLAASCDFRIAAENATFAWPETKIGLPTLNGGLKAARIMGLSHALEMLLMGDRVDAQWAYRTGLANKVVPQAELQGEAMRWAERLCKAGPLAVRVTKEVCVRGLRLSFDEAMDLGLRLRRPVVGSHDAKEGMAAFIEKRPARFEGR